MAAVKIVNEAPPGGNQANDHYFMWRATQEMRNAGWTVVSSSDGTTKTTGGTGWVAFTDSDNANSWICLSRNAGNSSQGVVFWYRNVIDINGTVTPSCVITYTTVGWNTAASTASTPPVSNGTTHYYRGNTTNGGEHWFGSRASRGAVNVLRMNFMIGDAADTGEVCLFGYASGNVWMHAFWLSPIQAATQHGNIGDPFACLTGDVSSDWGQGFVDPLKWRTIGSGGAMQNAYDIGLMLTPDTGAPCAVVGFRDYYISSSTVYLEKMFIATTTAPLCIKGFCNLRLLDNGVGGAVGNFYDNYNYVKTNGNMIFPWDGVTTTLLTS